MKKVIWFSILSFIIIIGLLGSSFHHKKIDDRFDKYQIVNDDPNEYCDPNQDPQCEIITDEDNPCNIKYDQCINLCKENELCIEKCDLEYEACLESY